MKRLPLIALAIAAPAWGQDTDRSMTPERYTALQSYFACIYQQVAALDDGVAAVESLTPKVAPTCRYLLTTASKIFAPNDQARRDALYNRWIGLEEAQVTRTVWTVRLERRADQDSAAQIAASALPAPAPVELATAETATPRPSAPKPRPAPAATTGSHGKPMSEWRRAYIAKHGHEPPVAAK